jgi:hypothetical protein
LENTGDGKVKRALPGLVFHRPHLPALSHSAYRVGDLKLVVNWQTADKELFDLSNDIGEANNVAALMPHKTGEMFAQLSAYLKAVNAETLAERPLSKGKKGAKKKK